MIRLTKQTLRAEHSHNMRHRVIEERCAHSVPHGKLSRPFHEKAAVLECAHRVGPCLATRVDETTVDPARHLVYLQPHVFRAISHDFVFKHSDEALNCMRAHSTGETSIGRIIASDEFSLEMRVMSSGKKRSKPQTGLESIHV